MNMQANTKLSVTNFEEAMRVPKALGLDPAAAELLASASSTAHQLFPGRSCKASWSSHLPIKQFELCVSAVLLQNFCQLE